MSNPIPRIIHLYKFNPMKWSWQINQKAVDEHKLDLDVIDLSIFELLKDFSHSKQCQKIVEGDKIYYLFSWKLVVTQQPILKLKTRRSVTKRYENLKKAAIIESHLHNKSLRGMWFCWGENYDLLIKTTRNESSSLGTNIPSTRYESSHGTRYESSHNTNIKNNTTNKDTKREDAPTKPPKETKKFQKPTLEELTSYFTEKKSCAESAETFFDHFESNGWKVSGRTAMKDWKAAARNWIRRDKKGFGQKTAQHDKGNNKKETGERHGAATVETIRRAAAGAAAEIREAREQASEIDDLFAWAVEAA